MRAVSVRLALAALTMTASCARAPQAPPVPSPSPRPSPTATGSVGGTYTVQTEDVQGEGCEAASPASTIEIAEQDGVLTVRASGLNGSAARNPDGSFFVEVTAEDGRGGTVSGRFHEGGITDGRFTAFGCTVSFTGTRSPAGMHTP